MIECLLINGVFMNILIFGASGMVGQGVLRECLRAGDVAKVLTVGRSANAGLSHPRLNELIVPDMMSYDGFKEKLTDFDACFFCLGVSSAGMNEAEYSRLS